jgi:hypothetical protein
MRRGEAKTLADRFLAIGSIAPRRLISTGARPAVEG